MSRGITIFNFKNVPAGFLLCLILFLSIEGFLYFIRPVLVDDYWNKFIINEHTLIDLPGDYDYLIIGDSLQKTGINPSKISANLLNLGLPGGKPMGLYIMFKRYLKKHNPPKIIFLYVDPENPYESSHVILRYFITLPEFIQIWKDLTWEERWIFLTRYWVSLDMRMVREVERPKYQGANSTFVNTLSKNQGYMPSPGANEVIEGNYFAKHRDRYQENITIVRRDVEYLNKFIRLCFSKKIRVVFLGFILPKELYIIFEKSGFNKDYLLFFEQLKKRYPYAYFVDQPILYLDNKYFGDRSHLNNEGSSIYTTYFKNQLFIPYSKMVEKVQF